jgi:hypothetical protein
MTTSKEPNSSKVIFTLDAREHTFLDVIKGHFKLDSSGIFDVINSSFDDCIRILSNKGIQYQDLKNALIPQCERNEIAFVFDSTKIESSWYSLQVFEFLLPLLEENSTNSILVGDLIAHENFSETIKTLFFENIITVKEIDYVSSELFYVIYLNNLSNASLKSLNEKLISFKPYVGYFDLNYSSYLKTFISTILIRLFIKHKKTIISAYEESEDLNVFGYPFEEYGYNCRNIEPIYYGLFLSYKIEREVFKGFESDTLFSLNAISTNIFNISDFKLKIEEKKLKYLLSAKGETLSRAGMTPLTLAELEQLIKDKLDRNYIYNLAYIENSKTIKFNLLIETKRIDSTIPMKLIVAVEYLPDEKVLRLITMF